MQWFGPEGMTIETHEIDISVGGIWRFDMVAADGTRHGSRMEFLKIKRPALLEVDYGSDAADDPGKFRMLVTFDQQSNGKTVVGSKWSHPSKSHRDHTVGFGAVEYGVKTLNKLAAHICAAWTAF